MGASEDSWISRLKQSSTESVAHKSLPIIKKPASPSPQKDITIAQSAAPKSIEVTLQIPKIWQGRRLRQKAIRHFTILSTTPQIKVIGLSGIVIIAVGVLFFSYNHFLHPPTKLPTASKPITSVLGSQTSTTTPTRASPTYPTLLPAYKTAQQLGGWFLISPPGHNPVYAFVDSLGGVSISVSEQPLPIDFQNSTVSKIALLAQSFGATEKISVNDLVAYIGTSAKGPQSVIFTRSKLLILIKSSASLTSDQWIGYISKLQ
jgi:hypothetical protein